MTALDLAAFMGKVDTLEVLVEYGADVRASGWHGHTALHHAAIGNRVGAIDFLISAGVDVEANRGIHGGTALHEASCHGSVEAILALLRYEAIVDAVGKNGETPLVLAIVNKKLSSVEALLSAGADVNYGNAADDTAPLEMATFFLKQDGMNAGVDVGASDGHGKAPIHVASNDRSTAENLALTQYGADEGAQTKSSEEALQLAGKEVSAIDALAAKDTDINVRSTEKDCSAHEYAAVNGEMDILKALVRHGADVNATNSKGYAVLHTAADRDQTRLIDFLIDAGADVNAKGEHGYTPLHIASLRGWSGAVTTLLKHGGDKECFSSDIISPLQLAAKGGKLSVVEALASAGADVNRRDKGYISALEPAAGEGLTDVLEALIRHGADVTTKTSIGCSALYEAAMYDIVAAIRDPRSLGSRCPRRRVL